MIFLSKIKKKYFFENDLITQDLFDGNKSKQFTLST